MTDAKFPNYPQVPYSALYIDMKYSQLLKGMLQFIRPSDRLELLKGLEGLLIQNIKSERMMVTISVRTFLDLALQVLNYPPGTEILMTAINIPDMVTVLRHHGLVPVPIEINSEQLAPKLEDFKKNYKPGVTKAIMVSYLYGARFDATEIFKWAREQKLMTFEDEAESFNGPQRNGHELADFTMFSFGTIKAYTAFGGAISIIRNNEGIYRKIKQIQESYPLLPGSSFLKKMVKNSILMWALNFELGHNVSRFVLTNFITRNSDYKEFVIKKLRGFQTSPSQFLNTFRYQCPIQMLYLLFLRMHTFNIEQHMQKTQKVKLAQNQLEQNGIHVVGSGVQDREFWLFPILTKNPELAFKVLVSRGLVGTYLGATQLKIVDSPIGYNYEYPVNTTKFFNKLVYLPIHKEVPQHHIDKIVEETIESLKIVDNIIERKVADYPKL